MMAQETTVTWQGETLKGKELSFRAIKEEWNEYEVEDGAKLRFRTIVTKVIRTEKRTETGDPLYIVRSSNVVEVSGTAS